MGPDREIWSFVEDSGNKCFMWFLVIFVQHLADVVVVLTLQRFAGV